MSNELHTFSKKQLAALSWWCRNSPWAHRDGIICDGAVRSGKTMCLSISFIAWAFYRFNGAAFALCGKTISSLRRNVILPFLPVLEDLGFCCEERISKNYVDIRRGNRHNRFYLFGGRDESSAALIQGMTLSGVLFDEVALMPRSFVEQALARCSVAGSKFFFNCNPEHPHHWFYKEWIQKKETKNMLYLHFAMTDNPSLLPEVIERYRRLYSGAFYERFVDGKWTAPQGLVYPMFSVNTHIRDCPGIPERYYLSCDYGTVNPFSLGLWGELEGCYYRIGEYYHDSRAVGVQHTDEEYYAALKKLVGDKPIAALVIDPSAASFIQCVRQKAAFPVVPAQNDVLTGIRCVCGGLKEEKLFFSPGCRDTLREFEQYRWEEQSIKDMPKKEYDHAMDDIRYLAMHVLPAQGEAFFAVAVERME